MGEGTHRGGGSIRTWLCVALSAAVYGSVSGLSNDAASVGRDAGGTGAGGEGWGVW